MTLRIAMWSGPRNISTAMMRSFEARGDCAVSDEPFYGCYLKRTGIDHPMAAEIIASMPSDYAEIAGNVAGKAPGGQPIWYQKHMTHHMLPGDDLGWLDSVVNCFLIRDPRAVVASYAAKRQAVTVDDIGTARQSEIFRHVADTLGGAPPVIDAVDILSDPARGLSALCRAIGISFTDAMLTWPPGRRESDGVWAAHWYPAVEASNGFKPYQPPMLDLPEELEAVAEAAMADYEAMSAYRLKLD